jgi:osmotically-inducible protein OsmY
MLHVTQWLNCLRKTRLAKQWFILIITLLLSSCLSGVWTGASLVYDRHNIVDKVSDFQLSQQMHRVLVSNREFEIANQHVETTVFNGDILLLGSVDNLQSYENIDKVVATVQGYRRLFNYIKISPPHPRSLFIDSWLTARMRASILANSSINPKIFKIVTSHRVIYILGDVPEEQGKIVLAIARNLPDVLGIESLLRYYSFKS